MQLDFFSSALFTIFACQKKLEKMAEVGESSK